MTTDASPSSGTGVPTATPPQTRTPPQTPASGAIGGVAGVESGSPEPDEAGTEAEDGSADAGGGDTGTGLRERKKQATREALSWAALRLAVDRGLENVRVEDIAAEAGVSPRTFNNYFSSKYEAIISRHVDRMRLAAQALRSRPAGEALWEAVTEAVVEVFGGDGPPQAARSGRPDARWSEGVRRMLGEPTLQAEMMKAGAAVGELVLAIAERTGTDAERDLYPRLAAAAVMAAQQSVNEQWLRADPPVAIAPLLREALDLIGAGLPDPSVGHPA